MTTLEVFHTGGPAMLKLEQEESQGPQQHVKGSPDKACLAWDVFDAPKSGELCLVECMAFGRTAHGMGQSAAFVRDLPAFATQKQQTAEFKSESLCHGIPYHILRRAQIIPLSGSVPR